MKPTQEQVIAWAREAGFESHDAIINYPKELQRFAAIVAAEEREACAKVCDKLGDEYADTNAADCAFAIRERGAP